MSASDTVAGSFSVFTKETNLVDTASFPTCCVLCANSRIVGSTKACVLLIVSPKLTSLSPSLRHQPASNHGRFQEERRNHYRYGRENRARLSFTPEVSSPQDSYGRRSSADCSSREQSRLSRPQLLRFLHIDDRDEQVRAFGNFQSEFLSALRSGELLAMGEGLEVRHADWCPVCGLCDCYSDLQNLWSYNISRF